MNEEKSVTDAEEMDLFSPSDQAPEKNEAPNEEIIDGELPQPKDECRISGEDHEGGVLTGAAEDPCENPADRTLADPLAQLSEMQKELALLREELNRKSEMFRRFGNDLAEFNTLYPEMDMNTLPDSVWEDIKRGIPMAAAVALAERRRTREEETARESNLQNKRRSPSGIAGSSEEYFSPAEVRAMSQTEVRENYQKIMRSIRSWH